MNNTASLKRTDSGWLAAAFPASRVGTIIAAVLLTVVFVSFRPFQPSGADLSAEGGGDLVNQLGFSALGGLAIFGMACFARPRVLSAFLSPAWIVLMAFVALSVIDATAPEVAMRTAFFTLLAMATIAAALAIPRDADAFSAAIAFAGASVVLISYAGLVLLPDVAVHTAAGSEPQHAGLWRGLFPHKNIAGPVMACFSFVGIYLYRRGWRWRGLLLLMATMIFVANTGSKTTLGLVPLSLAIVVLPGLAGMRPLTALLFWVAIIGTGLATLGIVFIDPVKTLLLSYFPDLTYTGRTTLWAFSGDMLAKHPWTGYGYDSFWGSRMLLETDQPFDRAWDIRTIVHGHNGYLDIAITMGLPALAVAVITFLVEPVRDFLRIPARRENIYLGDLFMMIVLFTTLNAFLESFFFRRADPVWLFFLLGVFGLRLAARFPFAASRAS